MPGYHCFDAAADDAAMRRLLLSAAMLAIFLPMPPPIAQNITRGGRAELRHAAIDTYQQLMLTLTTPALRYVIISMLRQIRRYACCFSACPPLFRYAAPERELRRCQFYAMPRRCRFMLFTFYKRYAAKIARARCYIIA